MYQPVPIQPADLTLFCVPPGLPPLEPALVERQRADAHWLLLRAGEVAARCSLWWRHSPPYPGHRLGLVGHYAAREAAAGEHLLALACRQLAQQGCTLAAGPMDGNTWQRYRLLTERGPEPVFFLEPDNPDDWPDHFGAAGFSRLAGYSSALAGDLAQPGPALERAARRAAARGVVFRPLELAFFEAELARIYNLALASFGRNLMYTPVSPADFVAQYRPLLS